MFTYLYVYTHIYIYREREERDVLFILYLLYSVVDISCFIPLFIGLQNKLLEFLILGFLVALISVLGDLFFSMLKRNKGIKDSSHLIPGHGGFIDLLDGTIATLPLLTFLSFRMNEFVYLLCC